MLAPEIIKEENRLLCCMCNEKRLQDEIDLKIYFTIQCRIHIILSENLI